MDFKAGGVSPGWDNGIRITWTKKSKATLSSGPAARATSSSVMFRDASTTTRPSERENPAIEFSWEGGDAADGTPLTGRGWAVLEGEELNGMIYIHCGDQCEFTANRA